MFCYTAEHFKGKANCLRKLITIDSILYLLKMAGESQGRTLNRLARKRYGNYRNASATIDRPVISDMVEKHITRDEHLPRVSFVIGEKKRAALHILGDW